MGRVLDGAAVISNSSSSSRSGSTCADRLPPPQRQQHPPRRRHHYPPLAWALPPIGGGNSGGRGGNPQQQQQDRHQQEQEDKQQEAHLQQQHRHQHHHHHHQHHHAAALQHLGVELAKVAGFAGAQLLLHLHNAQRAVAAGRGGGEQQPDKQQQHKQQQDKQQQQHEGARGAPWMHWWRAPWARDGGAGGGGGGGARGGRAGGSGAHAAAAAAAAALSPEAAAAARWVRLGDDAERRLDPRAALACYQEALALQPADAAHLCRVAKQWSDLTYEPGALPAAIADVNARAAACADRAIKLAPEWSGGHVASCVSRGRLALFSDNRTKVRLAAEARAAAVTALALDPGNDLAHHLMGRWHYEMAGINFVVRSLVKLLYGAALPPGTYADALERFDSAVALAPARLIHRVERGRALLKLGRRDEAAAELEAGLACDVEDVNAALERADAEALLKRLRGRGGGGGRAAVPELPVVTWGGSSSGSSSGSGSSAVSAAADDPAAGGGESGEQ